MPLLDILGFITGDLLDRRRKARAVLRFAAWQTRSRLARGLRVVDRVGGARRPLPGSKPLAFRERGRMVRIMTVEVDLENNGRFLAEVTEIPGAMAYGTTREEAIAKVQSIVLRVRADRIDHGEPLPAVAEAFTVAA